LANRTEALGRRLGDTVGDKVVVALQPHSQWGGGRWQGGRGSIPPQA
jgi:hypothetical protein